MMSLDQVSFVSFVTTELKANTEVRIWMQSKTKGLSGWGGGGTVLGSADKNTEKL